MPLRLHRSLEEAVSVAALGFGLVKRKVGIPDQHVGVASRRAGAKVIPMLRTPMTTLRPWRSYGSVMDLRILSASAMAPFLLVPPIVPGGLQHGEFIPTKNLATWSTLCMMEWNRSGNRPQKGVAGEVAPTSH